LTVQPFLLKAMSTLPSQISLLKSQISEVEQALELQKNPPPYKIDETAYPALNTVRSTLAQAATASEHQVLVAQIQQQLASQRKELAALEAELAKRQTAIAKLKAEQAKALAAFEKLEAKLFDAAKALIGLSQEIADEAATVTGQRPVVLAASPTEIDRRMSQPVDAIGRLHMGLEPAGLLISASTGFGGRMHMPIDCRRNAPIPAPVAQPETTDEQELASAQMALEAMQAGNIHILSIAKSLKPRNAKRFTSLTISTM
jgi:hypothetical protein